MKSVAPLGSCPPLTDPSLTVAIPAREAFAGLKDTDRAPREEILHRAYAIWEREGRPADRKLANWLEARRDVMGPT